MASIESQEYSQKRNVRLQQAATFAFLIYVLYLLGHSAWQNAHSNAELDNLKTQISVLDEQNQTLSNTILYQQTDSYRELEARRQLGIKKPGELVIALPPEPTENTPAPTKSSTISGEPIHGSPNQLLQAWWDYFLRG